MLTFSQSLFNNLTNIDLPLETAFLSFADRYEVSSATYDSTVTNSMLNPTGKQSSAKSSKGMSAKNSVPKQRILAAMQKARVQKARVQKASVQKASVHKANVHAEEAGFEQSCSFFNPCGSGLSCQPFSQKCYHEPRQYEEPCSLGYDCGSGLSCQPGSQLCYHEPRQYEEPCSLGYDCGSGLSCQPGSQLCYHEPRQYEEPCSAGYDCGSGLSCQPGSQLCYHEPRQYDEPCSAGYDCGSGLTCQVATQLCAKGSSAFKSIDDELQDVTSDIDQALESALGRAVSDLKGVLNGLVALGESSLLDVLNLLPESLMCDVTTGLFVPAILNITSEIGMFIAPFIVIVEALISAAVEDFTALTYASPRLFLPNASFIQMMTLPPDVWVNDNTQVSLTLEQAISPAIAPVDVASAPSTGLLLPAWHVDPAADLEGIEGGAEQRNSSGWQHPFAAGMRLSGPDGTALDASFPASSSTYVAQVTTGSSAAFGLLASSTVLKNALLGVWNLVATVMKDGLELAIPNDSSPDTSALIDIAVECMPFVTTEGSPISLQVSPGLSQEGTIPWATGSPLMPQPGETPSFRSMDGAFSDNTALVATVATITTECALGLRDCTSTQPRLFLVNDNDGIGGSSLLDGDPGALAQFFSQPTMTDVGPTSVPVGAGRQGPLFGTTIPSSRIFAEAYSDLQWSAYATGDEIVPYTSQYAIANLTTLDNPQWGVRAGYSLRIAFFNLGWKNVNAPLVTPSSGPLGGPALRDIYETFYIPASEIQVTGATPVLKDFLAV
jgi:hypothetical protein